MEIGSNAMNVNGELSNLDFNDEDEYQEQEYYQEEETSPAQEEQVEEEGPDVITQLLLDKGIEDPTRIKFAGENDELEERNWNDLSAEEQYNILSQNNVAPERYESNDDFSEEEVQLLNYMRQNNLTPSEYINLAVQQGIQNYLNNQPQPTYQVDEFTDDDLYMADLKLRTPDITDEELLGALETAKANPDLFTKQINGLREEYKALEEQNQEEELALQQEQEQENYQQFSETIFNSIDSLNNIGDIDIELDDNDKEDIATLILGRDQAGVNYLQKALSDPDTITKVAWFLLKGSETIDGLINYFTKEISKVRENSFKKGQESNTPAVVVKKPTKRAGTVVPGSIKSIDDIDF